MDLRTGLDGCGKSRPHRDFFSPDIILLLSLYFSRNCFFVLIVPAGFEPGIPASERPQANAKFDPLTATGYASLSSPISIHLDFRPLSFLTSALDGSE